MSTMTHEHTNACAGRHARIGMGKKVRRVAALGLAVGGAVLIGNGAFSSWTTTAEVNSGGLSTASGTPTLVDTNGGQFVTAVSNLLPGDYFYRYVDVRNDGTLTSTFTGSVGVTGDLAGQIAVDAASCTATWTTVNGVSTCSGTTAGIGSGTPALNSPVAINHGSLAPGAGATQHVRYKFTFSSAAPASLQGKNGSISLSVSNALVGGSDRTGG
ncbi:hypothetical protein ACQP00_28675 [Dactylosporangium sp. CS-047395]|uniref:hypothetical protein n=1 Tax=Dactylosporangium sp. CS-047395 TaxID=3239936 RepID=UPI003D8A81EA